MKRVLLLFPLALFVLLAVLLYRGLFLDPSLLPSALIGKPFPAFRLPALENPSRLLTRDDVKGQPALVNIWASWCVSCRREHPVLNQLASQGIVIYGVNYKDDRGAAQHWLRTLHNPYRLVIDDAAGTLGVDLGVYGAPETFVIDAQGVIRYKHVGIIDPRTWRKELLPVYDKLLHKVAP